MTVRLVTATLGYVAGVVLATRAGQPQAAWWLWIPIVCGLAVVVWTMVREAGWREVSITVALAGALGASVPLGYWRAAAALATDNPDSLRNVLAEQASGAALQLRGVLSAEPELSARNKAFLRLRVTALRRGEEGDAGGERAWREVAPADVRLTVQGQRGDDPEKMAHWQRLVHPRAYGYTVDVAVKYRPEEPMTNPGGFDAQSFLFQNGFVAQFRTTPQRITIVEESRGNLLTELALAAKERFLATYRLTIREPGSRLAAAATLGSRRALDGVEFRGRLIVDSFRRAGVGHVLAVSGLHVSIVSLLLYGLLSMTGMRPKTFAPLLVLFLVLFTLLTGGRPSSVRAAIMNSAVVLVFAYFSCSLRSATYIGLSVSSLLILLHNPIALFGPGFLLSFGAVLALVLLATPMERWLCRLRGASLLLAAVWFAAIFAVACTEPRLFMRPLFLLGAAGTLLAMLRAGTRLNEKRPELWKLGFERLPAAVRFFLAAQLAIQVGMMIPMSAWFFGQLPVGGMVVNLVAIPAVGILVQLAMLTGLLGLIPQVGLTLAAPLGATTGVLAQCFYWIADMGAQAFPFPAIPKPSLGWMVGYYAIVGLVLVGEGRIARAQHWIYDHWQQPRRVGLVRFLCGWTPTLVMIVAGALMLVPRPAGFRGLQLFDGGAYPQIGVVGSNGAAVVINGGRAFEGGRMFFGGLRTAGGMMVETAICPSADPAAGLEGVADLSESMRVARCFVSVIADTPQEYVAAIGDPYLVKAVEEGKYWARNYPKGWQKFQEAVVANDVEMQPIPLTEMVTWSDFSVRALPGPETPPKQFAQSANTPILVLTVGRFRWVVVTDSVPDAMQRLPECDVLVLPGISYRSYFARLVREAVQQAKPRLVILCASKEKALQNALGAVREVANNDLEVLSPLQEGALRVVLRGRRLEFTGFLTGRRVSLKATARETERPPEPPAPTPTDATSTDAE